MNERIVTVETLGMGREEWEWPTGRERSQAPGEGKARLGGPDRSPEPGRKFGADRHFTGDDVRMGWTSFPWQRPPAPARRRHGGHIAVRLRKPECRAERWQSKVRSALRDSNAGPLCNDNYFSPVTTIRKCHAFEGV